MLFGQISFRHGYRRWISSAGWQRTGGGIPYILSERTTGKAYRNDVKARARRWIGNRAAAIVANSKQGLEHWKFSADAVVKAAIPNGLPFAEIDADYVSDDRCAPLSGNAELLLYAGRYAGAKNVELVLETFIELLKRRDNTTAKMFGHGPLLGHGLAASKNYYASGRLTLSSHNQYLQVGFELGLPALLLFVYLMVRLWKSGHVNIPFVSPTYNPVFMLSIALFLSCIFSNGVLNS